MSLSLLWPKKLKILSKFIAPNIMEGTTNIVAQKAAECIEKSGEKGFILGSGCEVPMKSPKSNIFEIISTARNYVY